MFLPEKMFMDFPILPILIHKHADRSPWKTMVMIPKH